MFLVMTESYPGYWGRGDTEEAAIKRAMESGGRAPWIVRRIDDHWTNPRVDGFGSIYCDRKSEFADTHEYDLPPMIREVTRVGKRGARKILATFN